MTQENHTPNCHQHETLVTYLYGEATPDESRRFEVHLRHCASCRQELTSFETVRESLQQWQLQDLPDGRPNVRVAVEPPRRSAFSLLKELLAVTPLWAKGLGAAAAAMVLFAILGTEIRVGDGGVTLRADLLRAKTAAPSVVPNGAENSVKKGVENGGTVPVRLDAGQLEQIRAGLLKEVEARLAETERLRQEELQARLVRFEEQLKGMRAADLMKLAARVQEHNVKLQTIERDMDRREGLGLSDILFSDTATSGTRPGEKGSSE